MLPARIKRQSGKKDAGRRSPGHRKWVRDHACCACGSTVALEAAHVRTGTDGGMGFKPSDWWVISLCKECHHWQTINGEPPFEARTGIDMKELAREFIRKSPHRHKLIGWEAAQ